MGSFCLESQSMAAANAEAIETPFLQFQVQPDTGRYQISDKQGRVVWKSNPDRVRFGEVTLNVSGKRRYISLEHCETRRAEEGLELSFQPLAEKPQARLRVLVRPTNDGKALDFSYAASEELPVESVRLLDDAFWVTDVEKGYVVVPVREGLFVPADSGLAFTNRFDTYGYEGCHMAMFGIVKDGAAALVTWNDPYAAAELKSSLPNGTPTAATQVLAPSLLLRKSAKACRVEFLGRGDYVAVAKAYREVAKQKGWLVTWKEKLKDHPDRAKYFGASNYKLWSTLDRRMNEESTKEERVRVNWTFDEAAQVAEHLKRDLKLEKVLFIMGGWIHRGYDNQHPDILPTAPECGGDASFADACRRIRALGYILSLHDNYQDIYRDSPSWNERYVQKNADGSLGKGGHWAGGRAYITCSKMALELARPNLPAVKKLSGADSYFIDTTYAAGLQECFDKEHPLTRADDIRWKQAISDYAREVFGSFGSECGREWAIPHADFFEGLTGVSGSWYHNKELPGQLGASVVPLFELVYRDCIAMYGKYGYDPTKAAEYVLHHITIGRPLNYHIIPPHLYWKKVAGDNSLSPTGGEGKGEGAALFTRADHGWAEGMHVVDRFVKNTHEILSPLNEITARVPMTQHEFLSSDRKVQRSVFGTGSDATVAIVNASAKPFRSKSKFGGEVELPPFGFIIEATTFVAFHASSWNGLHYEAPVFFTLRSVNRESLDFAKQVRVFHGFGDARLKLRDSIERVDKEAVIEVSRAFGARARN